MRTMIATLLATVALLLGQNVLRADPPARGVTPKELESLARSQERVQVMYQRHHQAALVLGGVVLALLVFAGALRFVEATHGYYSGRLFAVVTVLVALIGFAVWWLM